MGVRSINSMVAGWFADPYGTPSLLRRLFQQHALPHWRSYLLAYVFMGTVAACTALYTYLLGRVVNETYFREGYRGVAILCAATVLVFVVRGLAYYRQSVLLARIGNQINAELQKRMFERVLQHSVGFLSQQHSSAFTAQLTYGCFGVGGMLNMLISASGRDLLQLIALLGLMFATDPLLAAIGVVLMPMAMLFLRKMVVQVRTQALAQYMGGTNILLKLQDTLQGMREVKAFRLERPILDDVSAGIDANRRAADKMADLVNRSTPLMEMLGGFAVAGIFLYAAIRIGSGTETPGQLVSFATAFLLAYEPAKRLARLNIDLANYLVPSRVLFEFLDAPATEPENVSDTPLKIGAGRIEFDQVTFAYRKGEPVIKNMSFVAKAGTRIALVGPSGAGKSTVVALLLRFHEPDQGVIRIDNQEIARHSRASLRDHIAYVGQDCFLFTSSIRANIACGRSGASEAEIMQAAKAANLHDFICSLPTGYDTPVGERGTMLSGGERQRVAIARALIKDAPIIVLDEATASLDGESELRIREAVTRLCRDRTTIIIAHRLHTITRADKILVIENGIISEQGTHEELLRRNARYSIFYRLQMAAEDDSTAANSGQRAGIG